MYDKDPYITNYTDSKRIEKMTAYTMQNIFEGAEALPELLGELWTEFTNFEGEEWCLLKSEIESIFGQEGHIYIRTKSSDVIQTSFTNIIEAKQMCL